MATRKSNHKSKKARKTKKSSMSKKSSTSSSSGSKGQMAYCMHGCKKMVEMVDGEVKIITMKNGNKRKQMVGKCKHCSGKVYAFIKN